MDLGKHVMDKTILDRDGFRAGKVDDLLLEACSDGGLRVAGIVTGPLALAPYYGRWLSSPVCWLYRLLGIANPRPAVIAWDGVVAIDVAVHVDRDRDEADLHQLSRVVGRLFARIPG